MLKLLVLPCFFCNPFLVHLSFIDVMYFLGMFICLFVVLLVAKQSIRRVHMAGLVVNK